MDSLDKAILAHLQRDGRASVGEIAESIGLSQTPCWRRIKKLEEDGVVRRVALAQRAALNLKLTAFVAVKTADHSDTWVSAFASRVARIPEIVELHRMSGEIDYLMKVVCPDMESFDAVYKRLISCASFSDVTSTFSMEEIKSTTQLPLDYI